MVCVSDEYAYCVATSARRSQRWKWTGIAGLLLAAVLYALGYGTWARQKSDRSYREPSRSRFPVRGIDVSHHQGDVDFKRVRAAGHAFVYLKATEGGDFVDDRFAENWRAARDAGLVVGAYHFFTFCSPGKTQAANFTRMVPVEEAALPPVLDIERDGNCARAITSAELTAEVRAMADELRVSYGRAPLLYFDAVFFRGFPALGDLELGIWLRDVGSSPEPPGAGAGGAGVPPWVLWQFSDRGRVDGVVGDVDLDAFAGDDAAFVAWGLARPPAR